MINLTIDDKEVEVSEGTTVLEAAQQLNIDIPTLCHDPRLKPFGACRLCIVEIAGMAKPVTSCTTPATKGMVVKTNSAKLYRLRKTTVELLLSDHPNDCMVCIGTGDCKLQELAYSYGIRKNRFEGAMRDHNRVDINPFITREQNKCVMCGLCVRVCEEVQGVGAIGYAERGFEAKVIPPFGHDLNCEFCGQCVSVCPTGALSGRMWAGKSRLEGVEFTDTTCTYCGCGCNLTLRSQGNQVIRVDSDAKNHNRGWLCVKGRFGFDFIGSADRLRTPLIRREKGGTFEKATWDEALDYVAKRFTGIKDKHGADALGGLCSARGTNEENYLFQKLIRAGLGTNNVDHCARYCHSATVAGLAGKFGSGAMTNSIAEIAENEALLVIGSNTTENHPVIGLRMKEAVRKGAKLIVADPRKIPLVKFATLWLRHRPGTDSVLLNAIMNAILAEGLEDKEFINARTEGYDEFVKSLAIFTPEYGQEITGVPAEDIRKAARIYGTAKNAGIYYAMGITQHSMGTNNVHAVGNLALLTGNVGKRAAGVNPLRGQNNVQGACDVGGLPNVYPGYQKVDDPAVKAKFEKAWGKTLPGKAGLTATEMTGACLSGSLKGMYIFGENPAMSDPNASHSIKAFEQLEFLVVQDIFMTETARLADVVLPGTSFAEKDGTFTSTERRIQRVRKAVNPPGDAKEDLEIIDQIFRRIEGKGALAEKPSAEKVFGELATLWPGVAGVNYERLEKEGLLWPCPATDHPGTEYLFKESFTRPGGKALFASVPFVASNELPDIEYPFVLTTGRELFHYHTGTMTRRSVGLNTVAPEAFVEVNPSDADSMGIVEGEKLTVTSRRGTINLKARVSNIVPPHVVFIPFHYHEAAANLLTNDAMDPICKIMEAKVCAVKIEKR